MANRYKITITFKDGDKTDHTIKESWTNLSAKGVKDTLKESLDVFLDDSGKPAAPVKSMLVKRLGVPAGMNKKFIDDEYDRMSAAWPVYEGALQFLRLGEAKWSAKMGDGVSVKIEKA